MDFTLGLDFGTHQTKLCLSYMVNNDTVFEFIEFVAPGGKVTPLLPSVIQLNENGTLCIGFINEEYNKKPQPPLYPDEPDNNLPPEPVKKYPPRPQPKDLNLIDKLSAWIKGRDRNAIAQEEWEKACAKIDIDFSSKHEKWKETCRNIRNAHNSWLTTYISLKNNYTKEITAWKERNSNIKNYRYFKLSTFSQNYPWTSNVVDADTLSIWYLTYILLYVKQFIHSKFKESFEDSVSVQMGVPAGIDTNLSKQMKIKAYKLLIAARWLMKNFNSPDSFCNTTYKELLSMTGIPNSNIMETAESYGFFVMPEAYAGLLSLTNRRRLSRGKMHLLADIGGGTTDIAFFTINEDLTPNVHTVISFHKGLNSVFESFCNKHTGYTLSEVQKLFPSTIQHFSNELAEYRHELINNLTKITDHVRKQFLIFTSSAHMGDKAITDAMQGCPIVYCGGGSIYEQMRVRDVFFTDTRLVNKDLLNIRNLVNRGITDDLFTILATSYGLSFPQFEDPISKDLSQLFSNIERKILGSQTHSKHDYEYGLTDD